MEITNKFTELPESIQKLLQHINLDVLVSNPTFTPISGEQSRGLLFEIDNSSLVIKWFTQKARADNDIEALLDLAEIEYIPKLYSYEKRSYLVMEKASGSAVSLLLDHGQLSEVELKEIKKQYLHAVHLCYAAGRFDWDFKLDHIFWDRSRNRIMLIDFGEYSCVSEAITTSDIEERSFEFDEDVKEILLSSK
ncbi:hypothetical protein POF51_26105 [Brevibacillus sp. AG]|uniref:protein kinase domain-containing protein n=1 Tax=Brevibacillus sp. AG TaxID=3020891 RepID=UPI00232AD707|nr:hypothetical protein [Brevibacillus sp. AG]MDC0764197.1 hypothetical protein [Brevibacillus sp. AG]